MAIGIDELDFDDDFDDVSLEGQDDLNGDDYQDGDSNDEPPLDNQQIDPDPPQPDEEDLLTYILKSKGISDPTKIKFEGDNGEIEELDWNTLTREEQINILTANEEEKTAQDEYSEAEIQLIQKLRYNQLTPIEYEQYLLQQGANNYAKQLEENSSNYSVDEIPDDELFIIDLQSQIGEDNITDEEVLDALERAKQNPTVYQKQIESIRREYRQLEKEAQEEKDLLQQQQQEEQFKAFSNQIQNSIQNFKNIGQLDISLNEDDMDEVAQFLLTADGAGINHFSKALNDPDTLVKMAWFALKGENAFDDITNYFTAEIKKREQASYQKGLADAAKKATPKNKFVYQPTNNINKENRRLTIDDLD